MDKEKILEMRCDAIKACESESNPVLKRAYYDLAGACAGVLSCWYILSLDDQEKNA